MTLRATIEIIPYGDEESKREIFRLDISNIQLVERGAFGHDICKYSVKVYAPESVQGSDMELIHEGVIDKHDRRDGAVALVAKAAELVKEHC